MEWLVLPHVSQGGKTGLDLPSLWLFILFALVLFSTLLLGLQFVWALPLVLLALFVFFRAWFFSRLSWRQWFWQWPGFSQWWLVGLGLSEFCCGACCVTVFMGISSGASKSFRSNSLSRCNTICSYAPFSKCAWLFDFFRWEAFWHRWIARWSLELHLRMRLLPISGVHLENQLTSGLRDWRPVAEISV